MRLRHLIVLNVSVGFHFAFSIDESQESPSDTSSNKTSDAIIDTRKKSTKSAILGLAVLLDVGGCSGSKFGSPGPKFHGEPESGFGSVGSAWVSALPAISGFGL